MQSNCIPQVLTKPIDNIDNTDVLDNMPMKDNLSSHDTVQEVYMLS